MFIYNSVSKKNCYLAAKPYLLYYKRDFYVAAIEKMQSNAGDHRALEREALRNVIAQWNANRLDIFELSEPNEVNCL